MQEDDISTSIIELTDCTTDNLLDSWPTPVIRIDLHTDGNIAKIISSNQGEYIRWYLGFNVFSVRRAKEARSMSENTLEYSLCERQFNIRMHRADFRDFGMRKAMIPDKMLLIVDSFHNVRVFLSAHSNHEKSCWSMVLFQNIENLRSVYWIGSIIKSENDFFW